MSYRDERDEIWADRADRTADRAYDAVTYHPWRTVIKVIAGLFLLSFIVGVIGFVSDYGSEAKRTVSVPNAREQTTRILDLEESMVATAGNYCSAKESKRDPNIDPTLVESPSFAYAATYRAQKAEYDRRMENFFEASNVRHIPLPGSIRHLPQDAPPLEERAAAIC